MSAAEPVAPASPATAKGPAPAGLADESESSTWAYIGIGSNIEPESNICRALGELHRYFGPLTVSSIYANPAFGFVGPDFLNLAVKFATRLPLGELAEQLWEIEAGHSEQRNQRAKKYASRALDLDVLLYGDQVADHNGVRVPRPEITRHAFVLRPLAEIAGDYRHPVLGLTLAELWARFDQSQTMLRPVALPVA